MIFIHKIMQFNFKKYIKTKYLNEALQSDILINKILNDKSKIFNYLKDPKSSSYKKLEKIVKQLENIIVKIFYSQPLDMSYLDKDGNYYIKNKSYIISDNDVKILHKQYKQILNQYINLITKFFDKPEPILLSSIIQGYDKYAKFEHNETIDLFNISDDSFEIFYFKDLKGNKQLKTEVDIKISTSAAFFITEDNKIQAITNNGNILILPLDSDFIQEHNTTYTKQFSDLKQLCDSKINENNLFMGIIYLELENGEKLDFPVISKQNTEIFPFQYVPFSEYVGFKFIDKFLNINSNENFIIKNTCKYNNISVGKIVSKASTLQKITNWGTSLNDYVIIYTASQPYRENGMLKSTFNNGADKMYYDMSQLKGYNEFKHSSYIKRRSQQRKDFQEIYDRTYKWVKDLLGKYKPYAGGKQNKIWEYDKKLNQTNYYDLYSDDTYNNTIVRDNIERYRLLLQQTKSIKDIKIYVEELKNIIKNINTYIINSKDFVNKIKETYKTDKDMFKTLMLLQTTYNHTISVIMSQYSYIQHLINIFNKTYNIKNILSVKNNYESNSDIDYKIKSAMINIKNRLDYLNEYMSQAEEINNKIEDILNNSDE